MTGSPRTSRSLPRRPVSTRSWNRIAHFWVRTLRATGTTTCACSHSRCTSLARRRTPRHGRLLRLLLRFTTLRCGRTNVLTTSCRPQLSLTKCSRTNFQRPSS
eukprot:Amastigsp_a856272_59.p2 type:complete len:103 gc:universal Amastigsp_a856272_59:103-411(+)